MQELLAALVSFFLVEPLQNELADKLAASQTPSALVARVMDCKAQAAPALVDRAVADPWWAVASAAGIWTGMALPEALLVEVAPGCKPALAAVQPFIKGEEA